MKILFIKPYVKKSKKFKIKFLNFYNNFFGFEDISAFFEASLRSVFKVKRMSASEAIARKEWVNKNFDLVAVDFRTDILSGIGSKEKNVIFLNREFKIPKILFVSTDKPSVMPKDEVLDKYDIVFKREPFINLEKYSISQENKNKIFSTMLSCPFIKLSRFKTLNTILKIFYPKYNKDRKYKYDIYFSGPGIKEGRVVEDYKNRNKIWERIKKENFNALGGIIPREEGVVPREIKSDIFKGKRYLEAINNSKICLAIDGVGSFTYRHLEIWQQGAFMLTTDSIDELDTPIKAEKNRDYVSFSSLDEMIEKIKYYLDHDEEREKIAESGRKLFEKRFNFKKHGDYIKSCINNKINKTTT